MSQDFLHAADYSGGEEKITNLQELFPKYGLPLHCVSDNGPQFCSKEFAHFPNINGVKYINVAPSRTAYIGLAEHMVQSVKKYMKACKGINSATY